MEKHSLRKLGKVLEKFKIIRPRELWDTSKYWNLKRRLEKKNALKELKRYEQEIKSRKTEQRS